MSELSQFPNVLMTSEKVFNHQKRVATINGEVVSDSTDSDYGRDDANVREPLSSAGIVLIKKRTAIRRKGN